MTVGRIILVYAVTAMVSCFLACSVAMVQAEYTPLGRDLLDMWTSADFWNIFPMLGALITSAPAMVLVRNSWVTGWYLRVLCGAAIIFLIVLVCAQIVRRTKWACFLGALGIALWFLLGAQLTGAAFR
jgi:hypothetical protein